MSKLIDRVGFFLVCHLVELPEASEALLSAEEGRLQLHLNAGGALHGGGFTAIGGSAETGLFSLLIFRSFFDHN